MGTAFAGGFYLGRRTAPKAPPESTVASPAPAPGLSSPDGGVALALQPPPSAPKPSALPGGLKTLSATLKGPFEQTITNALPEADRGIAEPLTQVVNRLLVWSLQVAHDGRPGDKLEVLYELPAGQEPLVHALRYRSEKLGKTLTAFRFKPAGAAFARYYHADGSEVEERLVDGPVEDYEQVTSLLRDGRRHKGVDFKCPVGTPVLAPFEATVVKRNWHFAANGNCLELEDAKGRHAIFLHLEAVGKEMQPGRKIQKGERIASSGNTGHSTAPHLHYQLEGTDGRLLDPFVVHEIRRVSLEGEKKEAFEAEMKRLEGLLPAAGQAG
jgi:murein DD-endopeptidase MepM/ murein hydrolase activator NlpD